MILCDLSCRIEAWFKLAKPLEQICLSYLKRRRHIEKRHYLYRKSGNSDLFAMDHLI